MEVDVKIDMPTESLDESDGTSFEISYLVVWIFFVKAKLHRLLDRSCYDGVREAQDFPLKFGIASAHVAQRHRHGEHPLPNDGAGGEDVVGQVCCGFGHPS